MAQNLRLIVTSGTREKLQMAAMITAVAAILDLGNMTSLPPYSDNANQNGFYLSTNAAF